MGDSPRISQQTEANISNRLYNLCNDAKPKLNRNIEINSTFCETAT